jgi:hypothetical protein
MSGRVEENDTGQAIYGYILLWASDGSYYLEGFAAGDYLLEDIAPGSYFATSDNYDGYSDELFDDLPCENGPPLGCDPTTGTPVEIQADQETTGIDFALEFPTSGAITGTIKDALTGLPIYSAVDVVAFNDTGSQVASTSANSDGEYRLIGLGSGQFYVWLSAWQGHSSELWEEIPCESPCDPTIGTLVEVVEGQETGGINFTLDPPGAIEGIVTDTAGIPLNSVDVELFGVSSNWVSTDVDGRFRFDSVKSNGDHFVRTHSYYRDELYDDIPCDPTCDTTLGTAIAVAPNQTTLGVSMALADSGRIRGTVTWESIGTALDSAFIDLYNEDGVWIKGAYTDPFGEYALYDVGPGPHYLTAYRSSFVGQLFDGIDCGSSCDPTGGTPVVTAPGSISEASFSLYRKGQIAGRITSALTGQPLPYCYVSVLTPSGDWIDSTYSQGNGMYLFDNLDAGNYILRTDDFDNLEGRLFDDIYCPGRQCDLGSATQLAVALNETVSDINFALGPLVLFMDGFESGDTSAW